MWSSLPHSSAASPSVLLILRFLYVCVRRGTRGRRNRKEGKEGDEREGGGVDERG